MNAQAATADSRASSLSILRVLLLLQAAAALAATIFLSLLAAGGQTVLGSDETLIRFAAGGALLFAILAAAAARGVRHRRGWSWTLAAILQVIMAVGTAAAVITAIWHPAFIIGLALPGVILLVLSMAGVRRSLGQA